MANRFRKLPQAERDLDSIWSFIADNSVIAANKQIERIGEIFTLLVQNPLAGRERPELRQGLRSFPAGNYMVFYHPLSDGIEVIRVVHGRQDIDADDMT